MGVFRDQIHKKGIRALRALVWEKTGGLSDFSKSFIKVTGEEAGAGVSSWTAVS